MMYDVVVVKVAAPHRVRLMAEGLSERNAEAVVRMAVARLGVEEEFYSYVPAGELKDGDPWLRGER